MLLCLYKLMGIVQGCGNILGEVAIASWGEFRIVGGGVMPIQGVCVMAVGKICYPYTRYLWWE
ncbi:hypothetical protein [Nodularia sp. UHCC 0506]|uniref:hypothetical protein n=1 Tax=Nodularia sp. UHCC 0506 TaxID=3110243 RepID=UPI002B1ED405|nr:hypothetical protein [Nodularia sp. UHCC 0506]MEA5517295.1 hypothetical protein [Nodularia sp. UHCC 0506]